MPDFPEAGASLEPRRGDSSVAKRTRRNPGAVGTLVELGTVAALVYVGAKVVGAVRAHPVFTYDQYGNPVEQVGTGVVVGGPLNDTSGQFSSGRT